MATPGEVKDLKEAEITACLPSSPDPAHYNDILEGLVSLSHLEYDGQPTNTNKDFDLLIDSQYIDPAIPDPSGAGTVKSAAKEALICLAEAIYPTSRVLGTGTCLGTRLRLDWN